MLSHITTKFLSLVLVTATALVLSTACASKNKDIIPDKKPNELYSAAEQAMSIENYSKAREYLEAIDSRYPFGPYAHQVQLNLIYSYYKDRENDLAMAEIDRFISLNPSDSHLDYVLYMRGLTNMQKGTDRFLEVLRIDKYDRDISFFEQAFEDFRRVVNNYPNSLYVADAQLRMIYIRNLLSRHELKIAKFYYKKQAYLSSARRCQNILTKFRDSEETENALDLLAKNYEHLNLPAEAEEIRKMSTMNFGK